MQNKARVRCYHICTRMANLRENHKYQARMQSNWKSHILLMGMQNGIATLEKFGSFLLTAAAAKSLQSCPTLCDPIDSSPPGSPAPGILQARTLEWAAISFSNVWKWKVKVKSLSPGRLLVTPWTAAYQAPPSMGFYRQEYWSEVPLPSLLSAISLYIGLHCRHTFAETIW